MKSIWNDANRAKLRDLAAKGMTASEIGLEFGSSKRSIILAAFHHQIPVILHTDAEIFLMKQRQRIRERRKNDKRKKPRPVVVITVEPMTSRTAPVYRNQLPRLPEMTKNELRAMLADAVRNTAEMA